MDDEDLIRALARLDDAVKALESRLPAALTAPHTAPADEGWQARYAALETRHEALRARTASAVERLGALLDSAKAE